MFDEKLLKTNFAACELFQNLNEHELDLIYRKGNVVYYKTGDTIIHEGQRNNHLYSILQGELEIFLPKTATRLSHIKLTKLGTGSCIGEFSFIDSQPASASVVATQNTALYQITKNEFEQLLETEQNLGRVIYKNLLMILVRKLRFSNEELDLIEAWS